MSDSIGWQQLIDGLREGDSAACTQFWQQYGGMLEGVATRQLSDRVKRRVGPEDVVQSACRTFFRRVSDGQFDLPDADALWRLMCAITLQKARRVARDQSRQKRSFENEQYFDATKSSTPSESDLSGDAITPLDEVLVADELRSLLGSLGEEECQVLDLKLQQFTNDEIAEKIGCSERTVRRLTKKIQSTWTRLFDSAVQEDE